MIAKDFPFTKDLQLIRGKSFAIMVWSPQGAQEEATQRKGE